MGGTITIDELKRRNATERRRFTCKAEIGQEMVWEADFFCTQDNHDRLWKIMMLAAWPTGIHLSIIDRSMEE